jgi:hypothetical protein
MLTGYYGGGQTASTVPDQVTQSWDIAHPGGRYLHYSWVLYALVGCERDRHGVLLKDTDMQYSPHPRD